MKNVGVFLIGLFAGIVIVGFIVLLIMFYPGI
jgi:hypothetical protein